MTKELLIEFKEAFDAMQKELGFNVTFTELDEIFFIQDMALQAGYVSPQLSRMMCNRIRETYLSWISQLHSWLVPNPSNMIHVSESNIFSEEERHEITSLIQKFGAFTSGNIIYGLTKDTKKESAYIDRSVELWNNNVELLVKYTTKVHDYWVDSSKKGIEKN